MSVKMEISSAWGSMGNMTPGVRLDSDSRGILRRFAASDRPMGDA